MPPQDSCAGRIAISHSLENLRQNHRTALGVTINGQLTTDTYTYAADSNRLLSLDYSPVQTQSTFTYDANGNIVTDSRNGYTLNYGEANRLLGVAVSASNTEFQYNHIGQRVKKTSADGAQSNTTIYHYDEAGNLLAEHTEEGAMQRQYIYADGVRLAMLSPSAASDTDGDGLDDDWELQFFGDLSETAQGDFDGDGFSNAIEFNLGSSPSSASGTPEAGLDTDADGLRDAWESEHFGGLYMDRTQDFDNDGLSNGQEHDAGTDPGQFIDSDDDGLDDNWEIQYFGDLARTAAQDSDGDGLSNFAEFTGTTNPTVIEDVDADGLPDFWELQYFGHLDQTGSQDFDADGISNADEYALPSSPVEPFVYDPTNTVDVDNDGLPDGWEILYFSSLSRNDTGDEDQDGISNLSEFAASTSPIDLMDPVPAIYGFAHPDLLAAYTMDNIVGTTLVDETNTFSGTLTGTAMASGAAGQALDFAGNPSVSAKPTDYVSIPKMTLSGDFALSWWQNPGMDSNFSMVGGHYGGTSGIWHALYFYSPYNRVSFRNGASGFSSANIGVAVTTGWHHFVASRSGDTISIFVNGELRDNFTANTDDLIMDYIGVRGYVGSSMHSNGKFDEIRIFKRALSPIESFLLWQEFADDLDTDGDGMLDEWEITYFGNLDHDGLGDYDSDGEHNLAEFTAGSDPTVNPILEFTNLNLLSAYTMDNIDSGELVDESASGSNAPFNYYVNFGAGISNNAAYMIDTSTYIDISDSTPDVLEELSISIWVNPDSLDEEQMIWSHRGGGNSLPLAALRLSDTGSGYQFNFVVMADGVTSTVKALGTQASSWQHVLVTFSLQERRLYLNGVLQDVKNHVYSTGAISSIDTRLGAQTINGTTHGRRFTGKLDQYRLFDRILTQSEIDLLAAEMEGQ